MGTAVSRAAYMTNSTRIAPLARLKWQASVASPAGGNDIAVDDDVLRSPEAPHLSSIEMTSVTRGKTVAVILVLCYKRGCLLIASTEQLPVVT
jgi:hypothetical protein